MGQAPKWVRPDAVLIFHDQQIEEHGGPTGLLDPRKLESALARLQNYWNYSEPQPDLAHLAAIYACGICQAHAFVDGNKRLGHAAMDVFLFLNGYEIHAGVDEQEKLILGVASGYVSREGLKEWLINHVFEIEA